jgi:uncharacterized protein YjiS (DUF1127 family)
MTTMNPHGNSITFKSRTVNEDCPICWLTWAKSAVIQMWTAHWAFRARHAATSHLLLLDPHLWRDIGIRRDQIDLVLESSTQPRLGSKLAAACAAYKCTTGQKNRPRDHSQSVS